MLLGLVLLSFLLALGATRRPRAPQLDPDCAKAAFRLSARSVEEAAPVAYTIVGPAGREYALGLDTRTFERGADGRWRAVPKEGFEQTFLTPAAPERMTGCVRHGFFATPVPPGRHTVTLYEITDRGAVPVEEQVVEVRER